MIYELRVYQIAPGKMETLHRVFKETVVPLFEQYGIKIVGILGADRVRGEQSAS